MAARLRRITSTTCFHGDLNLSIEITRRSKVVK